MAVTGGMRASLLGVVVLVASSCEASSNRTSQSTPQDGHPVVETAAVGAARCSSAIQGNADSGWRQRSTVVGNLGFYGPGRDFDLAYRHEEGGDLVLKLPIIIEGNSGATVWVPREERHRVALLFGKIEAKEPYSIDEGYARVRFEPCKNRKRTGFVGGLVLRDRRQVVLRVRVHGRGQTDSVTLGRLPATES
jgi:hypothetical protein